MSAGTWTVPAAKAKLSEVMALARLHGPQIITRHGRTDAVIVAAAEWERKTSRRGNLTEFFADSPLRAAGLKMRRRKDRARKLDL